MKKRGLAVLLVLILSSISLSCYAFGCWAYYIPLEDRFETADHGVIGTVTGIKKTHMNGMDYSVVELKVDEYLKNPLNSTSILFWSEGAPKGIWGISTSIQAYFDINEKVCVLLKVSNSRLYIQNQELGKIDLKEVYNMLNRTETIVENAATMNLADASYESNNQPIIISFTGLTLFLGTITIIGTRKHAGTNS